MLQRNFRKGDYIQIKEDINCIPAGTYKFMHYDDDYLMFVVGKQKAIIGIPKSEEYCLSKVNKNRKNRTSLDSFLASYYQLLDDARMQRSEKSNKPYTLCFLDPSVAYECH